MEKNNKQLQSIWGTWWEPIRKWFYPAWLLYETLVRFYEYTQSVYHYFLMEQEYTTPYIGEIGTQTLAIFYSVATFVICTAFLTVPTCFILYKFFNTDNLTGTRFELKMKRVF
ncbi:hypothetical protein ABW636_16265 [Aquimarina sp. 2201CG1-2-11]|uniref:hypothetical protein n=1 Tax=Aquimarina discodermiae TaxID=3231043 RepID=UPI0034631037